MTTALRCLPALVLLTSCTLATDAGDRDFTERLDYNFKLSAMSPHPGQQLDVALVRELEPKSARAGSTTQNSKTGKYELQARARVLVPPLPAGGTPFPEVTLAMKRVVLDARPLLSLFYADSTLDNNVDPITMPREHTWIRDVPETGEQSFLHEGIFENFFDEEIVGHGDIVLDVPRGLSPRADACLNQKLDELAKSTLEVRLVFNPETAPTDVGYFKMHNSNTLPTSPVVLEGIADAGSSYDVVIVVDGVVSPLSGPSAQAPADGALIIPFDKWFPVEGPLRLDCQRM